MLEQEAERPSQREDEITEMLMLAARLREARGGELDDAAIDAVSEATGTPVEYVRLALNSTRTRRSFVERLRSGILSLDPDVRRYVASGWLAAITGICMATAATLGDRTSFLGIITLLLIIGAIWNCTRAKDAQTAAFAGAMFGGGAFLLNAAFLAFLSNFMTVPQGESPFFLIVFTILGAAGGWLAKKLLSPNLARLGLGDGMEDRQQLLRQLVDLQDKLRSGEQSLSFLSLDIIGSTAMKSTADPLSVEFTFNEYHRYVEAIVRKHGGDVHSTAGDGITCAFESAQASFTAAKAIQAGLFELNTHRNRIGVPIRLRAAIHYGSVVAPDANIQSVNFAHVIDIAAHLQKACPEGCVVVSEAAFQLLSPPPALTHRVEAQDVSGFVWEPRVRIDQLTSAVGTISP